MKITEKLAAKLQNNWEERGLTLAFLGDSVTQGCFEIYSKRNGDLETVYDQEHTYHKYVQKLLSTLYPSVPISIINAGISGGSADHGRQRLEDHVLRYHPDLTVVCFGLNDATSAELSLYLDALREIFTRLQQAGSEVIFMTPNMMSTKVSDHLDPEFHPIAERFAVIQKGGKLASYLQAAKDLCAELGVPVCDCYAKWMRLYEIGVDTTDLLANYLNHPTRDMNWLFAWSLVETMLGM